MALQVQRKESVYMCKAKTSLRTVNVSGLRLQFALTRIPSLSSQLLKAILCLSVSHQKILMVVELQLSIFRMCLKIL